MAERNLRTRGVPIEGVNTGCIGMEDDRCQRGAVLDIDSDGSTRTFSICKGFVGERLLVAARKVTGLGGGVTRD